MDDWRYEDIFCDPESVDKDQTLYLHCTLVPSDKFSFEEALAKTTANITLGTLNPLKHETKEARANRSGKVIRYDSTNNSATIAIPIQLITEKEGLVQLLTFILLSSEYSYSKMFHVDQVDLPKTFLSRYPGPRFGIGGIRQLASVKERPLLGVVVRPRQGVPIEELTRLSKEALLGGCDIIADDLLTIDPAGDNSFEKRVEHFAKIADEATKEKKETKLYFANVSSSLVHSKELAKKAKEKGADGLIVNGFIQGFSHIESMVKDPEIGLPIISSNLGIGALTLRGSHVVSEQVISKISRIAGADAVHTGGVGLEFFSEDVLRQSIRSLKAPLANIQSSLPVVEMNITIREIPANFGLFGKDFLVEACSGVYDHPNGPAEGARAFRLVLEALHDGMTPSQANKQVQALYEKYTEIRVEIDSLDSS